MGWWQYTEVSLLISALKLVSWIQFYMSNWITFILDLYYLIKKKKKEKSIAFKSLIPRLIGTQINIFKVKMPLHWCVHLLWCLLSWKAVFKSVVCLIINVALETKKSNKRTQTDLTGGKKRKGVGNEDWTPSLGLLPFSYQSLSPVTSAESLHASGPFLLHS